MPTATASSRRAMRRGSWIAIAALVVTAAAIFGLTFDSSDHPTTTDTTEPERTTAIVSDTRHEFASIADLVQASDLVVSGRVIAAEAGRVFGGEDVESPAAAIRSHVLTLRVTAVLAGSHAAGPNAVVLVEEEAELTDGSPVTIDGMRTSRVGDDGIWFLAASRDPDFPGYVVVNSQGRYLLGTDSDRLQGGDASDALVGRLSALGAEGLADAVAGVAAR